MNEFFLNNSENIGFLIYCTIQIAAPLLVLFLLLLLIARKTDKSRKEKLRSIGSVLWEIISTSLLGGCSFFLGFFVREHILSERPDWINNLWAPSYILLGTGYLIFIFVLASILFIFIKILIECIKRR